MSKIKQTSKSLAAMAFLVVGNALGRLAQFHARVTARIRRVPRRVPGVPRSIVVDGVRFREISVEVEGFSHRVTTAGQTHASAQQTVVLMGGIPTDSSESLYWLVAELCNRDPALRCLILHQPFMEEHARITPGETLSRHNALQLPFSDTVDLSDQAVDPRYDHENQAVAAFKILNAMGIERAHLVGHDRGAVVFDYLVRDHADRVLSYSRGAQLWDCYEAEWASLAPGLIVGPPHRFMAVPWQCRLLFFAVIVLGMPIQLLSPGFVISAKRANRGSAAYDRWTHLRYLTVSASDQMLLKMKQTFMQTDSQEEIRKRQGVRASSVPIMQYQGEDEFLLNDRGNAVSDQPYFGNFNLFRNDIEDLFPGADMQKPGARRDDLLEDCDTYKLLELKKGARFCRFAIIPNAAHFLIIENPSACAAAISDFVYSIGTTPEVCNV